MKTENQEVQYMMLEFSGSVRHKGRFLHLLHYHGMSGLVQTHEESVESVDTTDALILKPSTATPKHMPTMRHLH
jgi:hypothetical protein